MRREFEAITTFETSVNSLMDTWPEWCEKLLKFAKLESSTRPVIKKIIAKLEDCNSESKYYKFIYN